MNNELDMVSVFREHNSQIYNFVFYRVFGNKEIAEDIAQTVFLRALQYQNTFNSRKSSIKTWLFSIAKNCLKDHYIDSVKEKMESIDTELLETIQSKHDSNKLDTSMMISFLFHTLERVSEKDRELIILFYINQLTLFEIAAVRKQSVIATKVALSRARKKLRLLVQ